jgi:cytochrome c oxidase subunit 2
MGQKSFELFPEQASSIAHSVDGLYLYLVLVSAFFSIGIAIFIIMFAVKYRRRSEAEIPKPIHGGLLLEITWSVIPLGLAMVMFAWGASIFFTESRPPADSMEIYVTGKQWMWKLQHMEGQREINELHIPVNRDIKLTATSEDVIHDFYVPAFRTKTDVLPGRYTTEWFRPTKVGQYHIFCAEYCGTKHSGMIGTVYVMEQDQFQDWLTNGGAQGSLAQKGEALFQQLGCVTCHQAEADRQGRCPNLHGIWGRPQQLTTGATITVTADYVRESILNPSAKIVAGYQNIMPTFQGLVTEDGIQQLIEYVKSIGPTGSAGTVPTSDSSGRGAGAASSVSGNRPETAAQQQTNPNAQMPPNRR